LGKKRITKDSAAGRAEFERQMERRRREELGAEFKPVERKFLSGLIFLTQIPAKLTILRYVGWFVISKQTFVDYEWLANYFVGGNPVRYTNQPLYINSWFAGQHYGLVIAVVRMRNMS
jgi:hypothetical protein